MSSILKVNTIVPESGSTITIGESGDVIKNIGPAITATQGTSSNPITFTVTVAAKTSGNVYNGAGSSNAYFINGVEAPAILIEGNESSSYEYYYKFDQSDNSNSGHPLVFYLDAAKPIPPTSFAAFKAPPPTAFKLLPTLSKAALVLSTAVSLNCIFLFAISLPFFY